MERKKPFRNSHFSLRYWFWYLKKKFWKSFQYPGHKAEKESNFPGLLRIKLWLGLNQYEEEWHKMQKEGDMAVFAETVR